MYTAVDSSERIDLFVAAGKIACGGGKLDGLDGTFVLNGQLDEAGYRGAVICRFVDPSECIRTRREMEVPLGFREHARASFLELRVASDGPGHDSTVGYADGKATLRGKHAARSARFVSSCRGHRGLQSRVLLEGVVGRVESTIEMEIGSDPPRELTARYRYRAGEEDPHKAECAGTLDLCVEESIAVEPDPRGEATRLIEFAGIGRILRWHRRVRRSVGPFCGNFGDLAGASGTVAAACHADRRYCGEVSSCSMSSLIAPPALGDFTRLDDDMVKLVAYTIVSLRRDKGSSCRTARTRC